MSMSTWQELCQSVQYADKSSEMAYQKAFIALVLVRLLGWSESQIVEQPSFRLGSTNRMIPDVVISKDEFNKFPIEFKHPWHTKTTGDIEQLLSYMKQMEVPVGIYVGKEIEVYFKEIGFGTEPILIMQLDYDAKEPMGDDFVGLFSADTFSVDFLAEYAASLKDDKIREAMVIALAERIADDDFCDTVKELVKNKLLCEGESAEIIDGALELLEFYVNFKSEKVDSQTHDSSQLKCPKNHFDSYPQNTYRKRRGRITIQRYAYDLMKQIVERNPGIRFGQLSALFNHKKNFFEDINEVADEKRWFMHPEDAIYLADGSKIVVSTQWGINGNCRPKMELLQKVAERFGIDTTYPF